MSEKLKKYIEESSGYTVSEMVEAESSQLGSPFSQKIKIDDEIFLVRMRFSGVNSLQVAYFRGEKK